MNPPEKLSVNGRTFNVRVEGKGAPLLFLGGSNFDLSLNTSVFDSDLPNHFTVAAADPRGLGQTDAPAGEWSMQDYAQDALLVMDALGWAHANVLGESFGAMVAMHLAVLSPDRVSRMALAAGSPGGAGGSSYPIETFLAITDLQERARSVLSIMDSRMSAMLLDAPADAEQRINATAASIAAFLASHNNVNGYPRLLRARATHDCWAQLSNVMAPTLVFAGRFDQQAPVERAENIASAMPNAMLTVVDNGHTHCFTSPVPVKTMVERWVHS